MLKLYRIGERVYQFEEGTQPAGAEPLEEKLQSKEKTVEPETKEAAPKNKARKAASKKG